MTTSLIIAKFKITDHDGETICVAAQKGRGGQDSQDPMRLEFPCGLSMTMQFTRSLHMGEIIQMNRVHKRHHELGHMKKLRAEGRGIAPIPWLITATAHYDNKEDPTELTSTHMTCSDMEE